MLQCSRFSLMLSMLFASLLAVCLPMGVQAANMDSEELAFVTLINDYRQQNGLQPLKISDKIDAAAEWMSADMAAKNYFSHTDSLGRDPFQRMTAFGYTYSTYKGENIAAGNSTASATFTQWKNSSGHNANMLNPNYKVMGIARFYNAGSSYRWYWTNDFGGYDDSGSTTTPPPPPPPTTDSTSPTVSITAPVNGATVSGTVALRASATDNVGVARVVFAVSNGTGIADSSAPYETSLNTTTMSNGTYTVTATAYDAAGNRSAQSVSVSVNNTATTPVTQRPGAPTNVRLTAQTTGALASWTPGTGGAPERYEVQVYRYTTLLSLVKTLAVSAPATSTRVTVSITGYYYIRVRAINSVGASAYSSWTYARVVAGQ